MGARWYLIIVLYLHFPMIGGAEYLFMGSLAICVSSLDNAFKFLAHFLIQFFFFFFLVVGF
jgi:hypothetical protein